MKVIVIIIVIEKLWRDVIVIIIETRLHKSRSSRDELEFDLSNFV